MKIEIKNNFKKKCGTTHGINMYLIIPVTQPEKVIDSVRIIFQPSG